MLHFHSNDDIVFSDEKVNIPQSSNKIWYA